MITYKCVSNIVLEIPVCHEGQLKQMSQFVAANLNVYFIVPQGHIEAVPIYACMAKRNIKEFSKVVITAIIICVVVSALSSVYCGVLSCRHLIYNTFLKNFAFSKLFLFALS